MFRYFCCGETSTALVFLLTKCAVKKNHLSEQVYFINYKPPEKEKTLWNYTSNN